MDHSTIRFLFVIRLTKELDSDPTALRHTNAGFHKYIDVTIQKRRTRGPNNICPPFRTSRILLIVRKFVVLVRACGPSVFPWLG